MTRRRAVRVILGLWLSAAGWALAAERVEAQSPPVIRITYPVAGTPVTVHPVLVRGTIEPADPDVRLTVNGQLVFLIQGGQWATLLDLPAGTHVLTVDARARGRLLSRAETRVTVAGPVAEAGPMGGWFSPLGDKRVVSIGTPPHDFLVALNRRNGLAARLDPDGTGQAIRPLAPGEYYAHTYREPGFHTPILRFSDATGQPSTQQMLVVLVDRAWLEPILQALWVRFWAAVERDDREEALSLVHFRKREMLRLAFEEFGLAELRKWAALIGGGTIAVERVRDWAAICRRTRDDGSIEITFTFDPTVGQWRYEFK